MEAYRHLHVRGDARPRHSGILSAFIRVVGWIVVLTIVSLARAMRALSLFFLSWTDRLVYLTLFAVEAVLLTRVFLLVIGADAAKPLPQTTYAVSSPLVEPVASALHLDTLTVGPHMLEPATLAALIAYVFGAWLLVVALNLVKRIVRLLI